MDQRLKYLKQKQKIKHIKVPEETRNEFVKIRKLMTNTFA